MAVLSHEPIMLIWLEKFGRHWKRRDEESCITECCFTSTSSHIISSIGCHLKCRIQTAVFARLGSEWLLFVSKNDGIRERT